MEPQQLDKFIKRIEQIDRLLEPTVKSLIEEAVQKPPEGLDTKPDIFFHPWPSVQPPPKGEYMLTRAVCAGTLMRIQRVQRRFPQLKESLKKLDDNKDVKKSLKERIVNSFTPTDENLRYDLKECLIFLGSETFGPLNPFTASAVFSALMDAGEEHAHGGVGALAFFAMVWALRNEEKKRTNVQQLVQEESNTYITAKCLLPIRSLHRLSLLRAKAAKEIYKIIFFNEENFDDSLEGLVQRYDKVYGSGKADIYLRWRFASLLEKLASLLQETAKISIVPEQMEKSSKELQEEAKKLSDNNFKATYDKVIKILYGTITEVLLKRNEILQNVKKGIIDKLPDKLPDIISDIMRIHGVDGDKSKLLETAQNAISVCEEAIKKLTVSPTLEGIPEKEQLKGNLKKLRDSHQGFANFLDSEFKRHAVWCTNVVEREIAHISAGNETDFDPSELVNAILVAKHWGDMRSELQVKDALAKALMGARKDGSWTPGLPFYTYGRALSIVPTTSDIVWPLAATILYHPAIDVADEAFERYLDWLDRTLMKIRSPSRAGSRKQPREVSGWASDRARAARRIDLWASALAINALLQIREIYEYRIWQLCEQSYTVLPVEKRLSNNDPVDLALPYKNQLHHKLSEVFRNVQDHKNYKDAKYTFVLHGPPGSSKTITANAIASEMWRSPGQDPSRRPRFVRITPADFTHKGEDSLDAEARLIFRLLQRLRKVTVFFDEIDDLLHKRDPTTDPTFMKFIVPAMLNRLQDLRDACPQQEICVIFATNYVDQIEPALLRKGRVDESLPIVYQDWESRQLLVWKHLHDKLFPKLLPNKDAMKDGWPAFVTNLKNTLDEQIVAKTKGQLWKMVNDIAKSFSSRLKDNLKSPLVLPNKDMIDSAAKQAIEECETLFTEHKYTNKRDYSCSELRREVFFYSYSKLRQEDRETEETLITALNEIGGTVVVTKGKEPKFEFNKDDIKRFL